MHSLGQDSNLWPDGLREILLPVVPHQHGIKVSQNTYQVYKQWPQNLNPPQTRRGRSLKIHTRPELDKPTTKLASNRSWSGKVACYNPTIAKTKGFVYKSKLDPSNKCQSAWFTWKLCFATKKKVTFSAWKIGEIFYNFWFSCCCRRWWL